MKSTIPISPQTVPELQRLQDLASLVQVAEGFSAVAAALQQRRWATIDGAWGSSAALAAAALAKHRQGPLLLVIAHPGDVDGWVEDIASFSGDRPVVFPAWDSWPVKFADGLEPIIDATTSQRLRLIKRLAEGEAPPFILATVQSLLQPVPSRKEWTEQQRRVEVGSATELDELARWLLDHGFSRSDSVQLPGQFSRRGGILDAWSPDADAPFRFEYLGDDVESIRVFDPQTQRSLGTLAAVQLTGIGQSAAAGTWASGHLSEHLPATTWVLFFEPGELREQSEHFLERVADQRGLFSLAGSLQQLMRFPNVQVTALPSASLDTTCRLRVESVERFSGDLGRIHQELANVATGNHVVIACHNEAERQRLETVLHWPPQPFLGGKKAEAEPPPLSPEGNKEEAKPRLLFLGRERREATSGNGEAGSNLAITLLLGHVRAGFRLVDAGVIVLSDHQLFQRTPRFQPGTDDGKLGTGKAPPHRRRRIESRAIDSFLELVEGDLVVHVSHGIARYRGMKMLDKHGQQEEHLVLEFQDRVILYVPASKVNLVQKYVGGARSDPELSRLGGTRWQKTKEKVAAATLDLACEMIELQALREAQAGIAHPPDSDWQQQFEAAFPYQETPDQLTTLAEIKADMQRARPMDRLICGDVGYGKTELAIRAAFKAVDNGRQVAVLVPTTILAEQHYRTFSQRLAEYPFIVEGLSRFRTTAEQKRIVQRLGEGTIDIIIGTHRLLSADVKFKDLGLVIIDEEQRFGVEHKERLKKLRQTVDVLTMTATPIPRTLHLSLLGIRDISNLETPPPDRLSIETRIVRWDAALIRQAILRELNREGQVFFVHNRVHNIKAIAERLQAIVPEARIAIGHGQMAESELEQAMLQFVRREADILVATTIIESGLDIPNANTIFINDADQYGLADLHQLRGRVGRYKHRAYAYLVLDSERALTPIAIRRLKAIEEFAELGAGFKIALRDLEIRGAGNILGTQQSGHIAAVGYELYCQLLENAVRRQKNLAPKTPLEVTIDLPWQAYLPRTYVDGQKQRLEVYRRLARVRRIEQIADFRQELRDRFGPVPEPAEWMLRLAELRLLASRWQIAHVRLEGNARGADSCSPNHVDLVLEYRNARRIQRLANQSAGRVRIVDDHSAYCRLRGSELEPPALFAFLKDLLRFPEAPV